jgi:hypothetical protein
MVACRDQSATFAGRSLVEVIAKSGWEGAGDALQFLSARHGRRRADAASWALLPSPLPRRYPGKYADNHLITDTGQLTL